MFESSAPGGGLEIGCKGKGDRLKLKIKLALLSLVCTLIIGNGHQAPHQREQPLMARFTAKQFIGTIACCLLSIAYRQLESSAQQAQLLQPSPI